MRERNGWTIPSSSIFGLAAVNVVNLYFTASPLTKHDDGSIKLRCVLCLAAWWCFRCVHNFCGHSPSTATIRIRISLLSSENTCQIGSHSVGRSKEQPWAFSTQGIESWLQARFPFVQHICCQKPRSAMSICITVSAWVLPEGGALYQAQMKSRPGTEESSWEVLSGAVSLQNCVCCRIQSRIEKWLCVLSQSEP